MTTARIAQPGRATWAAVIGALVLSALVAAGLAAAAPAVAQEAYTPDRFGTAARIAADGHPDGSDVVILASGEDYPDALAGVAVARAYDAPILLTGRDTVPPVTLQALEDLDAADILVLGGTGAISQDIVNSLTIDYQVTRIAGPDRFATAAAIAADGHPDGSDVVILASGENYPDALAGVAVARAYDAPILLTGRDTVPAVTLQALEDLDAADILVLGGPAAISQDVVNSLNMGHQVTRIAGPDRFATAAAIAADGHPDGSDVVILASGENYPDALAGVAVARAYDAPILLTGKDTVPGATMQALSDLGAADILLLGGTGAISQDIANTLTIDFQVSRIAGGP